MEGATVAAALTGDRTPVVAALERLYRTLLAALGFGYATALRGGVLAPFNSCPPRGTEAAGLGVLLAAGWAAPLAAGTALGDGQRVAPGTGLRGRPGDQRLLLERTQEGRQRRTEHVTSFRDGSVLRPS